ncbi:hypothetical protein K3495_g16789, partial [Podosphaera aphanis]
PKMQFSAEFSKESHPPDYFSVLTKKFEDLASEAFTAYIAEKHAERDFYKKRLLIDALTTACVGALDQADAERATLFPVTAAGTPYTPDYATVERTDQVARLPQICCRALELANLKDQQEEARKRRETDMKETADVEMADAPATTVAQIIRAETRKVGNRPAETRKVGNRPTKTKKPVRKGTARKGTPARPKTKPRKPPAQGKGKGKGSGNMRKT